MVFNKCSTFGILLFYTLLYFHETFNNFFKKFHIFKLLKSGYLWMLLLFSCSVMSNSLWLHGLQRLGFSDLYHLPEFAQTHVHWVYDTIQPFHPLLPSSPPDFNLSQHLDLFKWVSTLYHLVKVLELQFQHQYFQRTFRVDFL